MQLFKRNNLIIFLFLLFNLSVGQQYPSKNYSTLDGLSSNSIYSIFKDSRGILWVGTSNGLVKIIGNEIQNFYEKDGLAFNNCWDIKEDKNKNLWFASYGGGLTFYDGETFKIINQENGLVHNNIRKLFLHGNNIYVGTHDGVSIIDIKTFKISNLKIKEPKFGNFQIMDFLKINNIIYILTYRDGVWKIENNKLNSVISNKADIFCGFHSDSKVLVGAFDYSLLKYVVNIYNENDFINGVKPQNSLGNNVFWQLAKTPEHLFITGNGVVFENGGLFEITNNDVVNVSKTYGVESASPWSVLYDESDKKLYTGSMDKGFYTTDFLNKILFYETNNSLPINSIKYFNSFTAFSNHKNLEFRKSNVVIKKFSLVDFYKIANRFIKQNPKKYNYYKEGFQFDLKDNSNRLLKLKNVDNQLWLNTTLGVFMFDEKLNVVNFFQLESVDFELDFDNEIIYQQAYFTCYKSKNRNKNHDCIEFNMNNKNNPRDISDIIKLKDKILFFSKSQGIYEYKNGVFKSYLHNKIWNEKNLTFAKKINEKQIIVANAQGDVFVIDVNKGFQLTKKIDRELLFGRTINFLESYKNQLLIATEKGINIYDGKTIRLIDDEIGFKNNTFTSGLVSGDILTIGSVNGYYQFNLKDYLSAKTTKINLFISALEVNYKPVGEEYFKWFELIDNKIELPYDKNTLSITFNFRNHPYPNKLLYRYKVLGLPNTNWSNFSTNKTIVLPYLPNGDLEVIVEVKDLYSGTTSSHEILKIIINPPFWKTWLFIIGSIGFLFLLGFIIYKKRINYIQNQERTKSEVQKRLAETKMEALQSQMNPHFIFNAMNSIQNYIIDNNTDDALIYMGEFSKLIRQTLNNSSKTKINLLEELQYLQSYVVLENMRFKEMVNFDLKVSNEVDIFETEIPPMLIQPFLENAFIHAFDSSSINPKLNLSFEIKNNNLFIEINDNGKGLDVKNLNQLTQSKGIKLAQERISLFQPNEKDSIAITSKINEGTSIVLRISNQNLNDNS